MVATRNGQVWLATERGIAAWDGKKVRRVDTLRGLAENEIIDVAADQFDRVWARGLARWTRSPVTAVSAAAYTRRRSTIRASYWCGFADP